MTALPPYFQKLRNDLPYGNKSHYNNALEAIAIAWEALDKAHKEIDHEYMTPKGRIEEKPCWIEDAMRRIEELGKEKV